MRGDDVDTCLVCGHHYSFYPVDLPDWLPLNVVEQMVDIFGNFLIKEMHVALNSMDVTNQSRHKQSLSSQSVMSTSSIRSVTRVQPASPLSVDVPLDPV